MGKVHKAMLKKGMESNQEFVTNEDLQKVDRNLTLSSFINRNRSQKRIHTRTETDLPITITKDDCSTHGRVKNISRGGALVSSRKKIIVGEKIQIAIEIDGFSDVINAEAEVVRSYPITEKMHPLKYGIGIKYINISKECSRFFLENFSNVLKGKNKNTLNLIYDYTPKFFSKNIILIICILVVIFIYWKVEKIYSNRILSLEIDIATTKNYIIEFDKKINSILSKNYYFLPEKQSVIVPYFTKYYPYNYYSYLTAMQDNAILNDELSERTIKSKNKNQEINKKQLKINIGGLMFENSYMNIEN